MPFEVFPKHMRRINDPLYEGCKDCLKLATADGPCPGIKPANTQTNLRPLCHDLTEEERDDGLRLTKKLGFDV